MKGACLLIACVLYSVTAGAAELGRLFFTPAERANLDFARKQKKAPAPVPAATHVVEKPAPEVVSYGGVVRRSDGKAVLWINNRMAEEKEALSALSLKGKLNSDGIVTLQIPESGGSVDIKVGQSLEIHSGRIGEGHKLVPRKAPSTPSNTGGVVEKDSPAADKGAPGESAKNRTEAPRKPETATTPTGS